MHIVETERQLTNTPNPDDQQTKAGEQVVLTPKEARHDSPLSDVSGSPPPATRNWRIIRVPSVLHALLKRTAQDKGVSIHALITALLSK